MITLHQHLKFELAKLAFERRKTTNHRIYFDTLADCIQHLDISVN